VGEANLEKRNLNFYGKVFEKNRSKVETLTLIFSVPVHGRGLKTLALMHLRGPNVRSEIHGAGSLGDPPTSVQNFEKCEIG